MKSPWNTLEVTKLVVQALTPIAVAILGIYLSRLAKKFEHLQWRNQRLIEKRIAVYDDLAPQLNDLLCYFTFVGCWKELTPPEVVAMKRKIDKAVYLAAPLFPPEFFAACSKFLGLCFATFQGWGVDARLRTLKKRRRDAASNAWQQGWDACFADDATDPHAIQNGYQGIMAIFAREIGLNPAHRPQKLGGYPSNIA